MMHIPRQTLRARTQLVTLFTAKRRPLFAEEAPAKIVAGALAHCHDTGIVHGYAWVVLPDEVRWLLQVRVGRLPVQMQRFKTRTGWRVSRACREPPPRVWRNGFQVLEIGPYDDLQAHVDALMAADGRFKQALPELPERFKLPPLDTFLE